MRRFILIAAAAGAVAFALSACEEDGAQAPGASGVSESRAFTGAGVEEGGAIPGDVAPPQGRDLGDETRGVAPPEARQEDRRHEETDR